MGSFRLFRKREGNIRLMDKEDFLIKQIDEFKEKAKQLQGMLTNKESRAQQLQEIVSEREEKAKELETVLLSRQEEADGIVGSVKKEFDAMVSSIDKEIEKLEGTINDSVGNSVHENNEKLEDVKNLLGELNESLAGIKREINEKIHSENVKCYRNMQVLIIEMNKKLVPIEKYESDAKSLHTMIKCITWFSVINFVVLVGYILFQTGVFR